MPLSTQTPSAPEPPSPEVPAASEDTADTDEWRSCTRCGTSEDGPYYEHKDDNEGKDETLCLACEESAAAETREDCLAFARKYLEIDEEIETYDPKYRFAPTPEQYEMGDREAYTFNSVLAWNRHWRTNYDALIADLDRDDLFDRELYSAIRTRVDALLSYMMGEWGPSLALIGPWDLAEQLDNLTGSDSD